MTTNQEFQTNDGNNYQFPLPNATAILVLGIVSIVGCCFYAVPGIICGVIGLVLALKAEKLYKEDPSRYTISSYKNVNAGKICAIVGLSLALLFIIYLIVCIGIIGWASLSNPELLQERLQDLMN